MKEIYTIQTNNINALMEYVGKYGSKGYTIQSCSHKDEIWYSVTFFEVGLSSETIRKEIHSSSRYQLGETETTERYMLKNADGDVLKRFNGFYAVSSIKEKSLKGLLLFGCLPWDDNPITWIQEGRLVGQWFASIGDNQFALSRNHFVTCSLFDFCLQRLSVDSNMVFSIRDNTPVLSVDGVDGYELIEVAGFLK